MILLEKHPFEVWMHDGKVWVNRNEFVEKHLGDGQLPIVLLLPVEPRHTAQAGPACSIGI